MTVIFHLTDSSTWAAAGDELRPDSLEAEGFIHCSTAAQVAEVANRLFANRPDLVLLQIDAEALSAPLRWEDTYGHGQRYPHLYGSLRRSEVVAAHPYRPGPDGHFGLPEVTAPDSEVP